MASINKLIISVFFLLSLFSFHVHAREFFSKIPSIHNNNNFDKETVRAVTVPGTQEPNAFNPDAGKQEPEPEPTFYAQTGNSYGLYGHESGQLPPVSTAATSTTYEPYVTPDRSQKNYNNYPNNNRNSNYYNDKDTTGYENERQRFGETSFAENENVDRSEFGNGERQGMSDTRFMENGKYYYDINNEQRNNNENSNPNRFRPSSRGSVSSTSELYENNGGGYYGNTENSNYNARDFQNEMEFDRRQEEQFEP